MQLRLSDTAWKSVIAGMALLAAAAWLGALPGIAEMLLSGGDGDLGALFSRAPDAPQGTLSVAELTRDGPLATAGAAVGDRIVFDRPDEVRQMSAGQPVGLTIEHGGTARHVTVTPAPGVYSVELLSALGNYGIAFVALVLGVVIGLRQPALTAYRALSFAFVALGLGLAVATSRIPSAFVPESVTYGVYLLMLPCVLYCPAVFATRFPNDRPVGLTRWLQRFALPVHGFLCLALGVFSLLQLAGVPVPAVHWVTLLALIGRPVIVLGAFAAGWAHSTGELRGRFKWLTVSFGLWTLCAATTSLPWQLGPWVIGVLVYPPGTLIALVLLTYAVLRHRVFDFGFAVNRAAVYTVTTALLLVSFGLLEWAAEHVLHFESRQQNMLLDAGLALGVFLASHRVRDLVEHWIEQVLFHQWHAREAALRQFVRRAAHVKTEAALLDSLVVALDRFTGGAGAAVYAADGEAALRLARGSLPAAPPALDQDSPGIVALREGNAPLFAQDAPVASGAELALPMSHRGELGGFILLGPKPHGDAYRPDELEVLAFAAHQIGLDLNVLRVEALKVQCETQRQELAAQHAENRALQRAFEALGAIGAREASE